MTFRNRTPTAPTVDTDVVYPHCDTAILHAPGECEYCDRHPGWQEYRRAARINFTGQHDPDLAPCPSTRDRSDETRDAWPGNRPGGYHAAAERGAPVLTTGVRARPTPLLTFRIVTSDVGALTDVVAHGWEVVDGVVVFYRLVPHGAGWHRQPVRLVNKQVFHGASAKPLRPTDDQDDIGSPVTAAEFQRLLARLPNVEPDEVHNILLETLDGGLLLRIGHKGARYDIYHHLR